MVASSWVEQVRSLLAEAFEIPLDEIPPDLEFGGIRKWDSMGHMEIMLRLEVQYGIGLDADLIRTLTSITAIAACIEEKSNDTNT